MTERVSSTIARGIDRTLELFALIKALEEENQHLREENEILHKENKRLCAAILKAEELTR